MLQSALQEAPETQEQVMQKQIEQPQDISSTGETSKVVQPPLHENARNGENEPAAAQQGQQQQAAPYKEKTTVEWHQLIGAARQMWSKLSEAELLASEGEEQKLTGIVSARYVLSSNTANAQVKKFLAAQTVSHRLQPAG